MFSHEKLEVYERGLEFMDLVFPVFKQLPKGNKEIADQLKTRFQQQGWIE